MMILPFVAFLFATVVLLSASESPEEHRYQVEILARGMPRPMELEVADDGRVFFNDFYGHLKIFHPQTGEVVEAGKIEVFNEQENGFLGFALDREFESTQWIYLFYSPRDYVGQRLSRFRMDGDHLVQGSEVVVLAFPEQRRRCCHHAGTVAFAPDGCVLISTGDNTDPGADTAGYAPIDERPDHGPIDAQKSSANTHDLRGKILRIRPLPDGSYEIPEGNLFPRDGTQGRPEIYVMGCRNPWRMSVDEETGIVYWGDVGPDARSTTARGTRGYDEINQARSAGNYGWPYFVGNNFPYANYDYATGAIGDLYDPLRPVNDSPNNTGARILPPARAAMIFWPYAESPEFPMLGSGGRTACAGPVFHYQDSFVQTDGFPEHFDDCLLFWDWQRPFMKWARFDEDHYLRSIEAFGSAFSFGNEGQRPVGEGDSEPFLIQRPVDADFGPDGCLYLLDYGKTWGLNPDSQLIRISYRRGNLPPIARAEATPSVGLEPLEVLLSASGSKDPEGASLTYQWILHPGGQVLGEAETVTAEIENPGNYVVGLRVKDEPGLEATATLPLVVGNRRASVRFLSPRDGDFFSPGQRIPYQIQVEDPEDGSSEDDDEIMDGRTSLALSVRANEEREEVVPPGLAMMRSSDCFNCHAVRQRIVGPSLLEIADRYRGMPEAVAASVERVRRGSVGVWGEVPMLPHAQHSRQQVEQMVRWIFALEAESATDGLIRGLTGSVSVPDRDDLRNAILKASYTDLGRSSAGPLVGTSSIRLRNRRIQAEHCDAHTDLTRERNALGSIRDGATATFRKLNLEGVQRIEVQVSSGGAGGRLEVRQEAVSGPLVASFDVRSTGGWQEMIQHSAAIEPIDEWVDIVLVFRNPGQSALMNVDWIRFEAETERDSNP